MNDSSYTILIPALLLLSAAMVGMLYARFVSRSRENSEEVDLVDVDLAVSSISIGDSAEIEMEADAAEHVPFLEPQPEITPTLEVASVDEKEEEVSRNNETDYFDELQEAAAGLAALMRSSPVGKSSPVVYAPEDLDESSDSSVEFDDEPGEIILPVADSVIETTEGSGLDSQADELGDEPTAPLPLAEPLVKIADVETAALESEVVVDDLEIEDHSLAVEPDSSEDSTEIEARETENEALSVRALLGDDVAELFDSLDSGLEDLEDLVVSIESVLSLLNDGEEELIAGDDTEIVSEAA